MKKKERYRVNHHSESEFKDRVGKYIKFYNIERPHTSLDFKTPNKHESMFYKTTEQEAKLDKGIQKSFFSRFYSQI